jgi:hypothetical protein
LLFGRDLGVDDFVPLDHWQGRVSLFTLAEPRGKIDILGVERPHVVRVREAIVLVEALGEGEELGVASQVPLAKAGGAIALAAANLGDGRFGRVESNGGPGPEGAGDSDPAVVTTSEERRSRRAANGRRDNEIGELSALLGQAIEVRGGIVSRSEGADVGVSKIVHVDKDNIGLGSITLTTWRLLGGKCGRDVRNEAYCESHLQ